MFRKAGEVMIDLGWTKGYSLPLPQHNVSLEDVSKEFHVQSRGEAGLSNAQGKIPDG
jgi:hypothetical protein